MTTVASELPMKSFVAQIMGMPISVTVRGPDARRSSAAAVNGAFDELRHVEDLFSPWRPSSQVSQIQRGELAITDAHALVRHVANLCETAAARTGGAFTAWLPGPRGVVFDPTGLVKGWAVQRALDGLLTEPSLADHDLLINAGGDIALACRRLDTPDWVVAIEDPRDRSEVLRTVNLRSGAVATSGFAARGRHILHPATGRPASDELLSATVVGPELTWADVYATAAIVLGRGALTWLAMMPEHLGVLVTRDDQVLVASGR